MSFLSKYFAGWQFRTRTPTFEAGETVEAFVTRADGEESVVRIGDSTLRLDQPVPADARVRIRVTAFDASAHEGRADVVETLDSSAF